MQRGIWTAAARTAVGKPVRELALVLDT